VDGAAAACAQARCGGNAAGHLRPGAGRGAQRCVLCHNAQLQQKNVALHTPQLLKQHAQAVYQQVVVLKLMPMNNATQITDEERALVKRWFEGGAQERCLYRPPTTHKETLA
jgi:uncharacterized membrane protein